MPILNELNTMSTNPFKDEITLAAQTEILAKRAMNLGLIPSFSVHHLPDKWQFNIPAVAEPELLTPLEAYLKLKTLVEQSGASSKHGIS
jgi:hypothetical protein